MAQVTFTADTTPSLADLDANFTDLYGLRERISTPSYTGSSAAATIDSSGNIGVGTATPFSTNGKNLEVSDPAIARLWVRSTGTGGRRYYIEANTSGKLLIGDAATADRIAITDSGHVESGTDNAQTLGAASKRWSTVYAGTGTINTSDAREKTTVAPMTDAEIAAAKQLASEIGTYRFLDAIAAKGDAARTHVGMTVQRAIEVMESHGLDPMRYGFICFDEWEGGDRYAFRPDELLMFLMRGVEARLTAAGI